MVQGDAALYQLDVLVPNGWVNLDVEFEGGDGYKAKNLRVVSTGTVAYVPDVSLVQKVDGDKILVNFGPVYNPAEADTHILLEVGFDTTPEVAAGAKAITTLTVGTVDAAAPDFTVVANVISYFISIHYFINIKISVKNSLVQQIPVSPWIPMELWIC